MEKRFHPQWKMGVYCTIPAGPCVGQIQLTTYDAMLEAVNNTGVI